LSIKETKILYHWKLLLYQFRFCETHFTTYQRFVADQNTISAFLGGCACPEDSGPRKSSNECVKFNAWKSKRPTPQRACSTALSLSLSSSAANLCVPHAPKPVPDLQQSNSFYLVSSLPREVQQRKGGTLQLALRDDRHGDNNGCTRRGFFVSEAAPLGRFANTFHAQQTA